MSKVIKYGSKASVAVMSGIDAVAGIVKTTTLLPSIYVSSNLKLMFGYKFLARKFCNGSFLYAILEGVFGWDQHLNGWTVGKVCYPP